MSSWEIVYLNVSGTGSGLRVLVSKAKSDKWLILWPGITGVAEQFYLFLQQGQLHGVNVVAIDPPGHGFSEDWVAHLTTDDVRMIWANIMAQLGIHHAVIGGHSYGAYCALMSDILQKDSVQGTVLFDGGYEPFRDDLERSRLSVKHYIEDTEYENWNEYLEEEKRYSPYWDEQLADALKAYAEEVGSKIRIRMSVKAAWDGLDLMRSFDPSQVAESDKPVLLLQATLPDTAKQQRDLNTAVLQQRLKSLEVAAVPNAGHAVITDNFEFVTTSVWTFLSRIWPMNRG